MKNPDAFATRLAAFVGIGLLGLVWVGAGRAQQRGGTTHTIFLTALEVKGATTADKLAPPSLDPAELSKGYGFKAPGVADKTSPRKWEVSSYLFSPSFVAVRQGDTVALTVFVVNGDAHEVWITGPDGQKVVPNAKWQRGREYRIAFVAEKAGAYQLMCSEHAPSMIATFLALAR